MVKLLQGVEKTLIEKNRERQANEGIHAFWGIDSIGAFTRLVRAHPDVVLKEGQLTADFATMYTSFAFNAMIQRTMEAVEVAWTYEQECSPPMITGDQQPSLTLDTQGWSWIDEGYTKAQVAGLLAFLVTNNYTCNGGRVRKQIKGTPVGMPAAPQIANLACYPVEKKHSYALGPGKTKAVCRYIDDFWSSSGPSAEA